MFLSQRNMAIGPIDGSLAGPHPAGSRLPADIIRVRVGDFPEKTVGMQADRPPCGICRPVAEFVAVPLQDDLRPVGLGIDDSPGIGRNRQKGPDTAHEGGQQ